MTRLSPALLGLSLATTACDSKETPEQGDPLACHMIDIRSEIPGGARIETAREVNLASTVRGNFGQTHIGGQWNCPTPPYYNSARFVWVDTDPNDIEVDLWVHVNGEVIPFNITEADLASPEATAAEIQEEIERALMAQRG